MDVEISSAGWSARLRHVLRKDIARPNSFYENGAKISNQRRDKILRLKRVSGANGRGFLTQRAKHTTDDFRLAVEIYQSLFNQAGELQITIEIEMLLRFQCRLSGTT